ncbi:hypothetical protein A464_3103 [Salmonella bongori N268-08]|uniref:Uncharacterized protein n=1 Tax=Salmonella bongori N268-08 TaxID=1197719 RepID=S5NIZ4_SALBN|nr:hypothetical protein A464_3103 [Salmonella bongori N268-08]
MFVFQWYYIHRILNAHFFSLIAFILPPAYFVFNDTLYPKNKIRIVYAVNRLFS